MTYKTHALAGALAGGFLGGVVGAIAGGISALLPDLDHKDSFISRRLFFLSFFMAKLGHRQFTHSILGVLLFAAITAISFSYFQIAHLVIPAVAGYFSHLVIDAFTLAGVPFFYPKRKRYTLGLVPTNSLLEIFLFRPALIGLGIFLITRGVF